MEFAKLFYPESKNWAVRRKRGWIPSSTEIILDVKLKTGIYLGDNRFVHMPPEPANVSKLFHPVTVCPTA